MFWFFGYQTCGILPPRPGIEPTPFALEDKVLSTGPPGKSVSNCTAIQQVATLLNKYFLSACYMQGIVVGAGEIKKGLDMILAHKFSSSPSLDQSDGLTISHTDLASLHLNTSIWRHLSASVTYCSECTGASQWLLLPSHSHC